MTARAAFKKADVQRAFECAVAAGMSVARIDFNGEGFSIVLNGSEAAKRKNKADELYGPQA